MVLVEAFREGFSVVCGVAGAFHRRIFGEAFDSLCSSWGGATELGFTHFARKKAKCCVKFWSNFAFYPNLDEKTYILWFQNAKSRAQNPRILHAQNAQGPTTEVVEDHNLYCVMFGVDGVMVVSFLSLDPALSRVVAERALGWVASLYASEGHV